MIPRIKHDEALAQAASLGKQGKQQLREIALLARRARMRRAKRWLDAVQAARWAEILMHYRRARRAFNTYLALVAVFMEAIADQGDDSFFDEVLAAWQESVSDDPAEREQLTQRLVKKAERRRLAEEDDEGDGAGPGAGDAPAEEPENTVFQH